MRSCQRCGRPSPGGICPDCARGLGLSGGIENDDTVIEGIAPTPASPFAPPIYRPTPTAVVLPTPPVYRPTPGQEAQNPLLGFAFEQPGPASVPSEDKPKSTVGIVALLLVGVAVVGGGGVLAYNMLGGDDGWLTAVSTVEPSMPPPSSATPTPSESPTPSATPTSSAPLEPAPTTTVTATSIVSVAAPGAPTGTGSSEASTPDPPPTRKNTVDPPEPEFNRFYPLGMGDQGYVVVALQQMLSWRGVRTYVDGDFGNATERSVRQWQAQMELSVTGVVDDTTWEALLPELQEGSSGDAVATMQGVLWERGYSLEVDGDFGPQTDKVVRQFQTDRGITVDGVVGPITWAALLA